MPKRTPSPAQGKFPESDPRRNTASWKAAGTIALKQLAWISQSKLSKKLAWTDLEVDDEWLACCQKIIRSFPNFKPLTPDEYEEMHRGRFGRTSIRGF